MSLLLWAVLIYMVAVTCSTSWKLARLGCPALLMRFLVFLQAVFCFVCHSYPRLQESIRVGKFKDSQGQGWDSIPSDFWILLANDTHKANLNWRDGNYFYLFLVLILANGKSRGRWRVMVPVNAVSGLYITHIHGIMAKLVTYMHRQRDKPQIHTYFHFCHSFCSMYHRKYYNMNLPIKCCPFPKCPCFFCQLVIVPCKFETSVARFDWLSLKTTQIPRKFYMIAGES